MYSNILQTLIITMKLHTKDRTSIKYCIVINWFVSSFFYFMDSKKKKQFTTAVAGCDNITINKLPENLTNYIIWKLHTPGWCSLILGIYNIFFTVLLWNSTFIIKNKNRMQPARTKGKKSIEFYKARRHCRILLYCRKMPTEGFKWLSKRQPYLIYSAIVVQKAANERQDERDGEKKLNENLRSSILWTEIKICYVFGYGPRSRDANTHIQIYAYIYIFVPAIPAAYI